MAPTLIENELVTVVVIPLIALMQETEIKCQRANISCSIWKEYIPISSLPSLLLVAVEVAVSQEFLSFLQILHTQRK